MATLTFRKVLDLADIPPSWTLIRLTADWNGNPILLFVEGKPPRPARHAVYLDRQAIRTVCFERSESLSTFHVQPLAEGWLLADGRGGCGRLHDACGRFLRSIELGDAIEDLQTTPAGRIWVSYFDEGVFGGDIGRNGVVCFNSNGDPEFKYAEFAEAKGLPFISDCYAMNIADSEDLWLNYYTDFPLVHLHNFALERVWNDFGVLRRAFAVRDNAIVYAQEDRFESISLENKTEPEALISQDESGALLTPPPKLHTGIAARGNIIILNTGSAVYVSSS